MSSKKQFIELEGANYELCTNPPKDDSNFPSYEQAICPKVAENLQLVSNIYYGNSDDLLQKWDLESDKNFKFRKDITLFTNFLKKAIKTFPGFLSDVRNLSKLHYKLVETLDNVDGLGNNFLSFFWQADLEVIKSGFCGLLVDCPEMSDTPVDRLILKLIPRSDILSWSESFINGICKHDRVTIKEYINQKQGLFGSQQVTQYKTFFDDGSYIVQVILMDNDEPYVRTIRTGQSCITSVPIVFYSVTDINPTEAEPPLESLAKKNKAHYQLYSEYRNIIFRLNTPALVRSGLITPGQTDFSKLPPIIFGGTMGLDVPTGGGLEYVEPQGRCLETDRLELDKLEESMTKDTLEFIFGSSDKTATEVNLSSVSASANLSGMATLKQSAIEQVSELWGNYYGEYDTKGTCIVSKDLLNIPLSSQDMQVLSGMVMNDTLSNVTFLEMLNEGKRMPNGITPALEVKRIDAQKRRKTLLSKNDKLDNKHKVLSNVKNDQS